MYGSIEGVTQEQYFAAREFLLGVHKRALDDFGFYFGLGDVSPVRIEMRPLLSSGGLFKDEHGNPIILMNASSSEIGDKKTPRHYDEWREESIYTCFHETGHVLHCLVNPRMWDVDPEDDSPRAWRIRGVGEVVADLFAILCCDITGFFNSKRRMSLPPSWAIDLYKNVANGCGTAAGLFTGAVARAPIEHAMNEIPEISHVLDEFC